MSQEQDKIFFRNFTLTLAFIAAMMIAFYVIADMVTDEGENAKTNVNTISVAELTKPVGQVAVAGEESEDTVVQNEIVADASAVGKSISGESVYNGLCVNCHGIAALAAMIPQAGDATAWEPRIKKGIDVLYASAINGYTGELGMMPAKGGNPALSDEEVKAAVDYIINQVQ
jgi:cytochrome c5